MFSFLSFSIPFLTKDFCFADESAEYAATEDTEVTDRRHIKNILLALPEQGGLIALWQRIVFSR
jgi:hypothetical protein